MPTTRTRNKTPSEASNRLQPLGGISFKKDDPQGEGDMPQKTTSYRPTPASPTETVHVTPSATVEHTDELLDEIDACIEENALEVVRRFVQRGGQ